MTGKQRLRVLARYLTSGAVDDNEFTMRQWPQCAIGEASRLPSLEKEGLVLETDSQGALVPMYGGGSCYSACARFFSIPYSKAKQFFGPTERSAVTVGRALLRYLKRK
jgi:hypothetical protein